MASQSNSNSSHSVAEIKKLFVGADGKVSYTCAECGRTKEIDVSKYLNLNKEIRFKSKCPCGDQKRLLVERRDSFRKNTQLSGLYLYEKNTDEMAGNANSAMIKKPIEVVNLSSSGLRFRIMEKHRLKVGDTGIAEFVLNNKHRTLISQKVEIKNIKDDEVGARFCFVDLAVADFKHINFYLFNE